MNRRRTAALLLAVALAGCAGRVQTVHEGRAFSRAEVRAGRVAVGGVVLAARLDADPDYALPDGVARGDVVAQAEAWSPALYGALLTVAPDLVAWPFAPVLEACPDSTLARVLLDVSRGGVLRRSELAALGLPAEGLRYLAVARIDADARSLHEGTEAVVDNQRARDGRDIHGTPMDRSLKTRRELTVTLDLYDLQDGASLWTASVARHRDELYNFADAGGAPRTPVVPAGRPVITADGRPLPTAEFMPVLQDACQALSRVLLEEPGDR